MLVEEPDMSGSYSYADYLKWSFEERVELIKGKIFKMSPAPGNIHQKISMDISGALWSFLRNKKCKVYAAPFDVRIPRKSYADDDVITVLQPDICVVCDPSKLDERGCIGAPDIVVEILSPGNNKKELKYKYEVYEEAGVKEYWIVIPTEKALQKHILTNGKYISSGYLYAEDKLTTDILPGFTFELEELFEGI